MKRSKKRDAIVQIARGMPPLYHKLPDQPYNIIRSRVLWWLVKQPVVLDYIWDLVKQSGAIEYDSQSGKWRGVDFEDDD